MQQTLINILCVLCMNSALAFDSTPSTCGVYLLKGIVRRDHTNKKLFVVTNEATKSAIKIYLKDQDELRASPYLDKEIVAQTEILNKLDATIGEMTTLIEMGPSHPLEKALRKENGFELLKTKDCVN